MLVKINNTDLHTIPLSGKLSFGSANDCDVSLTELNSPHAFCINLEKYACILDVNSEETLCVNQTQIKKQALLNPGDNISIDDIQIKIIDDNNLPRIATTPFKLGQNEENNELLTSVSGLRSFNSDSNGTLSILDAKSNFTHKSKSDTPFAVSVVNGNLTLLCKKGDLIQVNGNDCDFAILKHGDYITTDSTKYGIESPGSSAYSKYSPSHPRNMQLSEEYLQNNEGLSKKPSFFKQNLWWISMVSGLAIIALLLFLIKSLTT